jgi:hypothetical protein
MADFVVYHNPDSMGYSATQVAKFEIVTNKRVKNALGDRVWLLAGEGHPRRFYLRCYFRVDSVEPAQVSGFRTRVSGKAGQFLDPMPQLDGEEWFSELKHTAGNFSLGYIRISSPRIISGLEKVAKQPASGAIENEN